MVACGLCFRSCLLFTWFSAVVWAVTFSYWLLRGLLAPCLVGEWLVGWYIVCLVLRVAS